MVALPSHTGAVGRPVAIGHAQAQAPNRSPTAIASASASAPSKCLRTSLRQSTPGVAQLHTNSQCGPATSFRRAMGHTGGAMARHTPAHSRTGASPGSPFPHGDPQHSSKHLSRSHTIEAIAGGRIASLRTRAVATETSTARQRLEERGPVVVVDNYDSFTYNLCQYLGDLGCHYVVHRNDDLTVEELQSLQPRGILISPGPGTPNDSGISLEVVKTLGPEVPLFGVCMGLQCIGQAFGGDIVRAPKGVMHGKTSPVFHNQESAELGLLAGLPRYHSLVIDKATFPEDELEMTAWTEDGLVMAARHRKYPHLEGVQFHPESVITSNGMDIVRNFLKTVEAYWA